MCEHAESGFGMAQQVPRPEKTVQRGKIYTQRRKVLSGANLGRFHSLLLALIFIGVEFSLYLAYIHAKYLRLNFFFFFFSP